MPRAPVFPLCLLVVTPDVVCTALPGRIPVCRDQVGVLLAAPIRPVAQPLVRRVGIGVEGDVPGVRLRRRVQQVRDARVDPHRRDVVGPHLEEVAPGVAGVLVKRQVERGTGADALRRVAHHARPIDRSVLGRVAREVRQRPRRHRVGDLGDLHVVVVHAGRPKEVTGDDELVGVGQRDHLVEFRDRRVAHLIAGLERHDR